MNQKSVKELRAIAKGIANLHNETSENQYVIHRNREIRLAKCERAIYKALKKEAKRVGGTAFKTSAKDRFRDSQRRESDNLQLEQIPE